MAEASISAITPDSLAALEIVDEAGNILAHGAGELTAQVKPGLYTVRLHTPEDVRVEKQVVVLPGEEETVPELTAPELPPETETFRDVMRELGSSTTGTVVASETSGVGPMTTPQLSTILTLVGSVANCDVNTVPATRLRKLGLRPFKERVPTYTGTGFQFLIGVESDDPEVMGDYLTGMGLRLWRYGEAIPATFNHPQLFAPNKGLAEWAAATEVGAYWLSVEIPKQGPIIFPLMMLPTRLAMLVFHMDVDEKLNVFQYLPELNPASFVPTGAHSDHAQPGRMRRLELIQRYYMQGQPQYAYEHATALLFKAEWVEPVAGLLAGYLSVGLNRPEELGRIAEYMTNFVSELSDSHVLQGWHQSLQGNDEGAAAAFRKALDTGIPLLPQGVERLIWASEKYSLKEAPRFPLLARVHENLVRGLTWTAWRPKPGEFVEGMRLE
jgi:hypothetical protein